MAFGQIIPSNRHPITCIELDVTNRCNLRCDYCYREDLANENMEFDTARRAIDWLIAASGNSKRLTVVFFGGEPLLNIQLIERVIPYTRRRCVAQNKVVHFTATSNCTIMSRNIENIWRKYGIGFHASIDGAPAVQNAHRRYPSGKESSSIIEKHVPRILALRPYTFARATVCPDTVRALYENIRYFESMGFRRFAFEFEPGSEWDNRAIDALDKQLKRIVQHVVERFRAGEYVHIDPLAGILRELEYPSRFSFCGAGRGLVSIDVWGMIRPCHRFNGFDASSKAWVLGDVNGGMPFNDELRARFLQLKRERINAPCVGCYAAAVCKGFCLAANLTEGGDLLTPPPGHCELVRLLLKHTLVLRESILRVSKATFSAITDRR